MATTSIWRVKGWLGKVVIYVENPDKTTNPAFFEKKGMTGQQAQALADVIEYAVNEEKTQVTDDEQAVVVHSFVSGVNCYPSTARTEMMAVKRRFGKEEGTVAYHGYQSFAPGEATPEVAHEIGVRLAKQLWGDKYQVLVATHLDKENHLHNHFVLNTVSFVDGIKYHRTAKDYYQMRKVSDALCREYGLSVIANPRQGRGKNYGEWRAEQEGRPTWLGFILSDVDEAICQSMTERQFFDALKEKGYDIKMGKDISVRPPGKERFVKLRRNFGEAYSLDGIRRRILGQDKALRPMPEPEHLPRKRQVYGALRSARKATGFRALYFHYCYLLGIFPKGRPSSRKKLHFLLREDLLKLNDITQETRLLATHHIDTAEELLAYRTDLNKQAEAAAASRKQLYKLRRTVAVKEDEGKLAQVKAEISALSKKLYALKREISLCDDIAQRSGVMLEKMKAVRRDESTGKETDRNEQFRRRGRTSRAVEP